MFQFGNTLPRHDTFDYLNMDKLTHREKNQLRFVSMTEMFTRESGIDLVKARDMVKEDRVDRIDLIMMATRLRIWLVRFRVNDELIWERSGLSDDIMRSVKLSDDIKHELMTLESACNERARILEKMVSEMAWSDHAKYTSLSTFDEVARVVEFCKDMERCEKKDEFKEPSREPVREVDQNKEPRRDPKQVGIKQKEIKNNEN